MQLCLSFHNDGIEEGGKMDNRNKPLTVARIDLVSVTDGGGVRVDCLCLIYIHSHRLSINKIGEQALELAL